MFCLRPLGLSQRRGGRVGASGRMAWLLSGLRRMGASLGQRSDQGQPMLPRLMWLLRDPTEPPSLPTQLDNLPQVRGKWLDRVTGKPHQPGQHGLRACRPPPILRTTSASLPPLRLCERPKGPRYSKPYSGSNCAHTSSVNARDRAVNSSPAAVSKYQPCSCRRRSASPRATAGCVLRW